MIDPATILFLLAAAGLKAVKARSAASEAGGAGEAGAEIGAELLTVLFAHHATEDVRRMQERFAQWLKGPAPHKNQDLERAIARCQILADLFCLIEALPGGIEDAEHKSWLRSVAERLPDTLKKIETRGFFADSEKAQIHAAKTVCEARLKVLEEKFESSKIEPSMLLKTKIDKSVSERLGREAADMLEGRETSSGDKIGALPERVREIFARQWFSYLTQAFRHELKRDGPVDRIYSAMRFETGFEALEAAVRDEGQKTRDHIDRALGQRNLTPHSRPAQQQVDTSLRSPDDSTQHVEGLPGWEAAYLALPIWGQFPVLAFCGRTTLSDAISSDIVEGPGQAVLGCTTGESETMTLGSVRYSGRQALTPTLPFVDRLAASHRKIVLFGDAGDGKTTLLRLMARQFSGRGMFPILIRAREWEESKSSIREFIQGGGYFRSETLGRPSSPILSDAGKALWACIEHGRAPILVDGLDEATNAESIGTALRDLPGNPIVIVTTRRAQYRNALPDFERFELHPFDYDGQVRPYVHVRLGVDATAFLERLDSDARVRALTGNGLMLAMLCTRWEQIRFDSRNEFDLPVARDELYAWATDYLLDEPERVGRTRHVPFCQNKPLKHAILGAIAFHGHICGGRALDIPNRTVERSTEEITKAFEHTQDSPNALEDIVQNSELLTQTTIRRSFRFFHPSFQEFYAARHLAVTWTSDRLSDWFPRGPGTSKEAPVLRCTCCRSIMTPFKELFSHQEYRETLLLLAGLVDDDDREAVLLATFQDVNLRLMILSRCRNVHRSVIEACLDSVKRGLVPSSDALRAMSSIRSHENMQAVLTGLGTLLGCGEAMSREAASIVFYEVSLLDRDGEILAQLENMLKEPTLRTVAARVLEKVGPNGATAGILARLLDLLDTHEHDDYLIFVRAICSLAASSGFESALSVLLIHEDTRVRLSAKAAQRFHAGEAATFKATELLKSGDITSAIATLRALIDTGFDLPRTRCHLARALVLNGDQSTARSQIDAAWNRRALTASYVRARIIWFKIAFALLDRIGVDELIDELRRVMEDKRSHQQWEINACLDRISSNREHRDMLAELARQIQQNPGS